MIMLVLFLLLWISDARQAALRGEEVILCREDTSADDIIGLEVGFK